MKVGEVSFKHCPTDDMVGDYLTKPLQGAKFIKFRDTILNVQMARDDRQSIIHRSVLGKR